jgi:hypothetical protein
MTQAKTKRDILRQATAGSRRALTAEEREDFKTHLLGPETTIRKALFVLDVQDLEWLDTTVARLKRTRRKTSKSELMRLGVSMMKQLSEEELRRRLRELD